MNRRLVVDLEGDRVIWRTEEKEIPPVPKDGIIVQVQNAGLCHSDVHIAQPDFWPGFKFPRVLSHEIGGVVLEIGDDLAKTKLDFAVGDRVIVFPWGNCKDCSVCRADLSYCSKIADPDFDASETYVYGIWKDGGFQNYIEVHDPSFLVKVPADVPMDVAAMVPCSGITAYHACTCLRESIDNAMRIRGKAIMGVMGAGGLGLWAVQIIKAMYPRNLDVVAIDINEDKLSDAVERGATKTFQWAPQDDAVKVGREFKQSIGCLLDGVIDFTGRADVQARGYHILEAGGTMTLIGLGKNPTPGFDLLGTILKTITIRGAMVGSRKMCREMFKLLSAGKVKSPPITEICLDDVENSAFLMAQNRIRGRHVVKF